MRAPSARSPYTESFADNRGRSAYPTSRPSARRTSLTATNANATHAVVRATVTETATGAAVTSGRVTAGNQTAALNSSGIATLTLSNPGALVRGEYQPSEWWRTDRPYATATDVAKTPGNYPDFQTLIQVVVVTILWFIPLAVLVFGFDYMSDGALLGLSNRT